MNPERVNKKERTSGPERAISTESDITETKMNDITCFLCRGRGKIVAADSDTVITCPTCRGKTIKYQQGREYWLTDEQLIAIAKNKPKTD